VEVLDIERVTQGAGHEQAAACDRENDVGLESIRCDEPGGLATRVAEDGPGEFL
jgi:hypothetical protein